MDRKAAPFDDDEFIREDHRVRFTLIETTISTPLTQVLHYVEGIMSICMHMMVFMELFLCNIDAFKT